MSNPHTITGYLTGCVVCIGVAPLSITYRTIQIVPAIFKDLSDASSAGVTVGDLTQNTCVNACLFTMNGFDATRTAVSTYFTSTPIGHVNDSSSIRSIEDGDWCIISTDEQPSETPEE
jgi:hypothetical protein